MFSGSQSSNIFEIGPGVEDGEMLMEEKEDPDTMSAEIFVCV
jgi:hypothetical protein